MRPVHTGGVRAGRADVDAGPVRAGAEPDSGALTCEPLRAVAPLAERHRVERFDSGLWCLTGGCASRLGLLGRLGRPLAVCYAGAIGWLATARWR